MAESSNMLLLGVFERAALMLMALFFLSRIPPFRNLLGKNQHSTVELVGVSVLFCTFAVLGTYTGIPVDGSLVNVRTIAIMSGGILFGPWVGISAGIVSGVHRYLIDLHGHTALPCLISSICAGFLSLIVHYRGGKKHLWCYGILASMGCEILTMVLIMVIAPPGIGHDIVAQIAWPMIAGSVCTGLIIKRVQDLDDEKELVASRQARLALIIANETLPYFQEVTEDTLAQVCAVIRQHLEADAVAITDRHEVLAFVGHGREYYERQGLHALDKLTEHTILHDQILVENDLRQYRVADFHSVAIIPLREHGHVTGTLKIFFCRRYGITGSMRELALGLSQLISTQMEVSRIKQLQEMARKAEFRSLQNKINPHFLFNALNAISSLVRRQPSEARQLISRLADYLRYNLSLSDGMIDIQEELQQVRDYVAIEMARFGSKLTVVFNVEDVHMPVPSLLLQPLVENAILHGIQPLPRPGEVVITVRRQGNTVCVNIRDNGCGIAPAVISAIETGNIESTGIGLMNVNARLKLLYGRGLSIERLEPGTSISLELPIEEGPR
jgi:two-component system LytT family sensor kinase